MKSSGDDVSIWKRFHDLRSLWKSSGNDVPHDAGYAVRSLNFDGRTSMLRLEVRAANFQQIELFRKVMKDNSVSAKLLNSSARGKGVLARLELSEIRP